MATAVVSPKVPSTTVPSKGIKLTSPRLTSLFACNRHEKFHECVEYANTSYAESLEPVAIIEDSTPHSRLAKLGSCTAVLYPQGDFDRLPATIDGYMAFLFLDDLIDNSTEMSYIEEITSRFMATAAGTPTDDKRFFLLSRFFTDKRWDKENLVETIAEAQRFMDGALALRAIEIEKRLITVEEYLDIRVPNTAMGFMFRVIGFAQPELVADLNKVIFEKPDLWDRVERPSGKCIGIALDLFKLNGLHAEVCSYTNVVKIWQRESPVPIDEGEAMRFMVEQFYRYEKDMAHALDELAEFSPGLAQAVKDVQGGTLGWMNGERGGRYSSV